MVQPQQLPCLWLQDIKQGLLILRAPNVEQRGRGTPDTSVYVILTPLRHQCAPGMDSILPWLKAAVEPSSERQVGLAHLQQKEPVC